VVGMFDALWHVLVFYVGNDGNITGELREFDGVMLNDFNGGGKDELTISAHPKVSFQNDWENLLRNGQATFETVDLATYRLKRKSARFQTSELCFIAFDEEGRKVRLRITPSEGTESPEGFVDQRDIMGTA
jgi:hypothetical protein